MSPCLALPGETEASPRRAAHVGRPRWPRRILVASHGTRSADAAVVAARELAEQTGGAAEIVVAYVPRIPVSDEQADVNRCERPECGETENVLRTVHSQRRRLVRHPSSWPLSFDVGDPVPVMLRVARTVGADLVVLGIGRANPDERRCGGRAPQFAVRHLEVPVYAAAEECASPTRCVIALPDEYSQASTIRAALACVAPGARVWIARPDHPSRADVRDEETHMPRATSSQAFAGDLEDQIAAAALELVTITGDMSTGVLRLADAVDAQLIVVPIRGAAGPVRSFLPNIAEPLLSSAQCSVLVVPEE